MTEIYQPTKTTKASMDLCVHDMITFARQIGVAGVLFLLIGGAGTIAIL